MFVVLVVYDYVNENVNVSGRDPARGTHRAHRGGVSCQECVPLCMLNAAARRARGRAGPHLLLRTGIA